MRGPRRLPKRPSREAMGEGSASTRSDPARATIGSAALDGALIAPGQAWTLTRALAAHRDVADAEPAIDQPGLEPPPGTLRPAPARTVCVRATSAPTQPLPCAKTNRSGASSCAG